MDRRCDKRESCCCWPWAVGGFILGFLSSQALIYAARLQHLS